jgi:hypothetical protein
MKPIEIVLLILFCVSVLCVYFLVALIFGDPCPAWMKP